MQRLPAITHQRFSLIRVRSPLLPESQLFSLPAGTEMFHFPAFPPHTLYIQVRVTHHNVGQVSPFGHPRITARLPTPRGLSQATTSFFGSQCQGIHRTPLQNYTTKHIIKKLFDSHKPKMLASTIQLPNNPPTPHKQPKKLFP